MSDMKKKIKKILESIPPHFELTEDDREFFTKSILSILFKVPSKIDFDIDGELLDLCVNRLETTTERDKIYGKWEEVKEASIKKATYEIHHILDDVKTYCEFDTIHAALSSLQGISRLPLGDRKEKYEKKREFERTKERVINDLKTLKIYDPAILKKVNTAKYHGFEYDYDHKKSRLKISKKMLYEELTKYCKTETRRATRITEILDFL